MLNSFTSQPKILFELEALERRLYCGDAKCSFSKYEQVLNYSAGQPNRSTYLITVK